MMRTVWIVVTPCGTQAILSLLGTLSSSSCTRKPSAKPATHPRQVASRWMRAASLFPSLSTLEQASRKSLPDRLISGCSAVLVRPVLAGEQTKKIPSSAATRSRRTAVSNPLPDSTSDSGRCQQTETLQKKAAGLSPALVSWVCNPNAPSPICVWRLPQTGRGSFSVCCSPAARTSDAPAMSHSLHLSRQASGGIFPPASSATIAKGSSLSLPRCK
jgi:hypothetical protein